jgi:hypothetical protein
LPFCVCWDFLSASMSSNPSKSPALFENSIRMSVCSRTWPVSFEANL